MGWKEFIDLDNRSYTFKGGLAGLIISLIFFIIYSLLYFFIFETTFSLFEPLESFLELLFLFWGSIFGGVTLLFLSIPGMRDLVISHEHGIWLGVEFTPFGTIINIIGWIVIGILVGFILEKNKNKGSQQ